MSSPEQMVNVRYMVDDVQAAIDGAKPGPGGWNPIHLIVPDIGGEVTRLGFRNGIVTGPGGKRILVEDPAGNVAELFEPASGSPARP